MIVRIDNLTGQNKRAEFFERLNRHGAHLISPKAQGAFIGQIQADGYRKPTFVVVDKCGWAEGAFVLPNRILGKPNRKLEADLPDAVASANKYGVRGTLDGWKEIPNLARGNSRFILALALGFVGPLGDILQAEQVAMQFVGDGGSGKTSVAFAAGSIWGTSARSAESTKSLGFMETWNNTENEVEQVAAAHNHTFLILDETRTVGSSKGKDQLAVMKNVIMKLERSSEKGRMTATTPKKTWWTAVLSTSNLSLDELALDSKAELDDAFRGRMIDIPLPEGGAGVFQDLHGLPDVSAISGKIRDLAQANHGVAAQAFLEKLTAWRAKDENNLKAWLNLKRRTYLRHAKALPTNGRELGRFHQKFATVYAAGRLAKKFGLLNLALDELRNAILQCERDHLAHVASAGEMPVKKSFSNVDTLSRFLKENRSSFVDLRNGLPSAVSKGSLGYINVHNGSIEYLLTGKVLVAIMGSEDQVRELKRDLGDQNLLVVTKAGQQKLRYTCKRQIALDQGRATVTAIKAELID
ncbi:DUF927 domain-containing protein [Mesorhizobium sp. M0029]